MRKVLNLLVGLLVFGAGFAWGIATIHQQVWPYSLLVHLFKEPVAEEIQLSNRQRRSIFDVLTDQRDVVFLGDSVTELAPWSEMFPGTSLANRGIGGERFANMLTRLDDVMELQPQAVFLMGGANDALKDDLQATMTALRRIVETLAQSEIDVYLQTTIEPRGALRPFVHRLNTEIRKFAAEEHVTLIDTSSLWDDDGVRLDYSFDGVHLNGRGMAAWRAILAPYITDIVESKVAAP